MLGNEIVYPFAIHNGEQKRELFTGQSGRYIVSRAHKISHVENCFRNLQYE